MCKSDIHDVICNSRVTLFFMNSLYAYRIWIGVCVLLIDVTETYGVPTVSKGRSRVLPAAVVGLLNVLGCFILLICSQCMIITLASGEPVTRTCSFLNHKIPSGVVVGESAMVL
jgi:hypothetical protein